MAQTTQVCIPNYMHHAMLVYIPDPMHDIPTRLVAMQCVNLQVEVPRPLVGFVIGRNGEHINNIQSTCGVRLQFQSGKLLSGLPACIYVKC